MLKASLLVVALALCSGSVLGDETLGTVVSLNDANFDHFVQGHELVMVDFFADWCRFCQMLKPIYEQAAKELANQPRIRLAKVDCEDPAAAQKKEQNGITKFPTLKIFRNGHALKQEYRGQRSVPAISSFLISLLADPVTIVSNDAEVATEMGKTKRAIVGKFPSKDHPLYNNFLATATALRDDCTFIGYMSPVHATLNGGKGDVSFRHHEEDVRFEGSLEDPAAFLNWAREECNPLVREITFENGEELTEEGLPFLILFYDPANTKPVKEFREIINKRFQQERGQINFITADGLKFSHPLRHLGKEKKDLPVLAFDTFKHMYLFKKFNNVHKPGKLEQFVQDLHSGKLHHEFHNPPANPAPEEEDDVEIAGTPKHDDPVPEVEVIPDDRKETIAEKISNAVEEKVEMVEAAQQVKKAELEDKKKKEEIAKERGVPAQDLEHHEEEGAKPIAVKSVMGKLKPSQNRYSFREEL